MDAQNESIELTNNALKFKATSDQKPYAVEMEFYEQVNPDESKHGKTGRGFAFVIKKQEPEAPYWPRLLKQSGKQHWLKTDFSKWKDEDEDDDVNVDAPFGGMDMAGMGGMGGMGGMPGGFDLSSLMSQAGAGGMAGMDFGAGGMEMNTGEEPEGDSDDDEMPALEEAK